MVDYLADFVVLGDIPRKVRRTRWHAREIVDTFIASGNECMGKRYGSERDARGAYYAFRQHLKKNPNKKVTVHLRGDMLILTREA